MLIQCFVWVFTIIGLLICINNTNVKDKHPIRGSEANHSRIPTEVTTNLDLLCIGIPPCDLSPATPPWSERRLSCCGTPCILGSYFTAYEMYATPHISAHSLFSILFGGPTIPLLLKFHVCSTVNRSLQTLHVRGGFYRVISRLHFKASQKWFEHNTLCSD